MTRAQVIARVRQLPGELARSEAVAAAVAQRLAELARSNFEVLSAGGVGADGTRWKPLAPSTIRAKGHDLIGLDTAEMARAVLPQSEPGVARVTAETDHTASFDAVRPLFPEELPGEWVEEAAAAGAAAAAEEIRDALGGR